MHQPWYREAIDGDFHLPWVYLHALKDYADMASHLECHPHMHCVVNFTPVLLEQIDDYARECQQWLKQSQAFSDPLLNFLCGIEPIPAKPEARTELVQACLRAHAPQMIDPYPAFRQLVDLVVMPGSETINQDTLRYLSDQYFYDLLTWYHIAWLGYSVKQLPVIQTLIDKGQDFNVEDRSQLIGVFDHVFGSLIDRYRRLAQRGQVELSMTPYAHPIVPLLLDFKSMHDAMPEAPTPAHENYPDGDARARWHLDYGIEIFEKFFKQRPKGVWLSEGAVSEAAVALLDSFDIKWTASGEGVWHNSTYLSEIDVHQPETRQNLFRCNQLPGINTRLFFRDDGLSDLIGFEYQSWNAEDAAADFINHLGNIANFLEHAPGDHVVSVILDGENAWEYYPDNGYHFLHALYTALAERDDINLQTFSQACETCPPQALPKLCAGSWVYGTFSTWVGEEDKNRGWDLLVEAKHAYDKHIDELSPADQKLAELQLAICEGSDWFWWFGDYNPSDSVKDFDQLYRLQLRRLYDLLKLKTPKSLLVPVSEGGGSAENAGTMRRGHAS